MKPTRPAGKKLLPLSQYLSAESRPSLRLTYNEIETIIGSPLPEYAKSGFGYWANARHLNLRRMRSYAWLDHGYKALVDHDDEAIVFDRMNKKDGS